jgi:murein DD-endopeptidase MepM/ murein hydrolase activator NlpD
MGVHWIPAHQRNEDISYIQQLKPFVLKIVDPDPNLAKRALEWIDPNGFVWLRDWALSEQKADMVKDPTATGLRHANDWIQKLTVGRFKDLPLNRIIVSGINEPFVHDDKEESIVFEYTKTFLKRLTEVGIKGAALNLSVGWPRNKGKDLPPIWDNFLPLEDIINAGDHFLCTHEYWYSDPDESWFQNKFGWLAHRIQACPMAVPIIIGETGMEKRVDLERYKNDGSKGYGWQGNVSPKVATDQIWRYADKVNPNVVCVLPFTTDWASHDWDTQDTKGMHDEILAQKRSYTFPSQWPIKPKGTPTDPIKLPSSPTMPKIYSWPKGTLTQYYGDNRYKTGLSHSGLDLASPLGTEIEVIIDGIVEWVDFDKDGYGYYVRIHHPKYNLDTFYAHLNEPSKLISGRSVKAGDLVGYVGSTGNSTGSHLHLEVRLKNKDGSYKQGLFNRGQTDPLLLKHLLEI